MGSPTVIHVCTTCRGADDPSEDREDRAGARLHRAVLARAAERGDEVEIVGVECLSVCKRPCTIAFASPGKWTYVYGDFPSGTSADLILDSAALYAAAPDGLIPWKQRPDAIKKGVVARMPPLSQPKIAEAAE